MGCTRNHSRIWVEWSIVAGIVLCLLIPAESWAAFATQFSLTTGEEYNDNIFFSKSREHDFITFFVPTLTLLYAPEGQVDPTLTANISPSYQLFARHSDLNNFDNVSANGLYTYQYSPRLNFNLSDSFQRLGSTRTSSSGGVGAGGVGLFQTGPTSPPPVGGVATPSLSQNLNDLTQGTQASNFVSLQGSYLYRPDISFTGGVTNGFTRFTDAGGTDAFTSIGARGIYNWRQEHNLHAGYTISINNLRDGDNGVVHNFDLGDSYFTNYNIQLTPTLSLAASTGLSLNTSNSGPRVGNNTSITITKLWETAQVNGGLRKGLTPSLGVAGISDTTSLFTNFNWRLTEKLSTYSSVDFSYFDTDDVIFKTFQASLGLQYLFTTWLSAALSYNFNWIDSGSGANSTDLLQKGVVKSNSVFLSITTRFDLWPNTGLARSISSSALSPVLTTPFPTRVPQPSP